MAQTHTEKVIDVHHWSNTLFTIKTTRDPNLRFRNGEFTMVGMEVDGKPLLRAYSIASSNYEDHLEFYSIKVQDGPLTSKLQHIKVDDELLVSKKPTGTLLWDHMKPGKHLYLLGTGTGLAPFLSIIKDPEVYENFERVILVHGCRRVEELTYQALITKELGENEYFGEMVRSKLIYYPATTREGFKTQGRITALMESGKMTHDIGLPDFSIENDRFMLCGSVNMLKSTSELLDKMGFRETRKGEFNEYVVERAFVVR
ncbi:MAG: ferredoxin--NADP reductase [Gammaproteobacteria bacterium]|nr:ferredoxin--NADP reductase [Gammaproteobacteria bacterium]